MEIDCYKIDFKDVPYFSKRDIAYSSQPENFEKFVHYLPQFSSFQKAIKEKHYQAETRKLLNKTLEKQYAGMTVSNATQKNIELLKKNNCFTLVTAHQPSLFTGPLYYIYKIVSILNLAEHLNAEMSEYHFVPVFVSGSEDHDFDEVNHFNFFNNKFEWQSQETGPVGRMTTAGLADVLEDFKERLGDSENASNIFEILKNGISKYSRYGDFVFYLVNEIFGKFGLVYLNMDQPDLKRAFIPYLRKELIEKPSQSLIEETQNDLDKQGFKPQAHARLINLFYLQDGRRDRIEYHNGKYQIVDTPIQLEEGEILELLETKPENFSPNVALRPVYQEAILPNLAYVGGGGELAYWTERKTQFEYFGLKLPLLLRRDSVLWIDKASVKQINKLDFGLLEIFEDSDALIRKYIERHTSNPIDISSEQETILNQWEFISQKAKPLDPTFAKSLNAEMQKLKKNLDHIAHRFLRIEKHNMENEINKIRKIKEKLFPNNGLQERHDNFLQFYLKYGDSFIQTLKSNLDVLDRKLTVIVEK